MKEIIKELNKKTLITDDLLTYGFTKKSNKYVYEQMLIDDFKIVVEYDHVLTRKVIDINTNDEYLIIDLNTTLGSYAAKILEEANKVINDIVEKCSRSDEYLNKQTKEIINYVKKTYKGVIEHPWEDENIVIRHLNNKKWYLLLMPINKNKLDNKTDKDIEVINLKTISPKDVVNNINIYPAYHMNKKNWITVCLDGSLNNEIIYSLIDISYDLTK